MALNFILLYTLLIPVVGIVLLIFIPRTNEKFLKLIALNASFLAFLSSLVIWLFFQKSYGGFQFVVKIDWIPIFNLNFVLGIDGISLPFLILTTFLIPLCILTSWNSVNKNMKEYLIIFLLLDFFLIGAFTCLDVLLFYIFFESIIIPMFLLIGLWGSRTRKILAAYYFFFILYQAQF